MSESKNYANPVRVRAGYKPAPTVFELIRPMTRKFVVADDNEDHNLIDLKFETCTNL